MYEPIIERFYWYDEDTGMEYWHDGEWTRAQCHDGVGLIDQYHQSFAEFERMFPNYFTLEDV